MNKIMNLTPTESLYLEALSGSEKGLKREDLYALRPPMNKRESNVVDVHIKNLRRKMRKSGRDIETVRGFGYRIIEKK